MKKKLIVSVCLIIGLAFAGISLTAATAKFKRARAYKVVKGPIKMRVIQPDLRITKVELGSNVYKLKVTVENRGLKAAGPCVLQVRTLIGGSQYKTLYKSFAPLKGISLDPSPPKNKRTIIISSSVPVYPTLNRLKIDVFNTVHESNEKNNDGIGDWLVY